MHCVVLPVSVRLVFKLSIGPSAELLREPTIIGMRAIPVGQAGLGHQPLEPLAHRFDIAPSEQLRQGAPLGGSLGVQREMYPAGLDRVVGLEFFNTHGTEITPGSDVVGKNLKRHFCCHDVLSQWLRALSLARERTSVACVVLSMD